MTFPKWKEVCLTLESASPAAPMGGKSAVRATLATERGGRGPGSWAWREKTPSRHLRWLPSPLQTLPGKCPSGPGGLDDPVVTVPHQAGSLVRATPQLTESPWQGFGGQGPPPVHSGASVHRGEPAPAPGARLGDRDRVTDEWGWGRFPLQLTVTLPPQESLATEDGF